jgi:hypothetical protein
MACPQSFQQKDEDSLLRNIAKSMNFFAGQSIDNFKPLDLLDTKQRDVFYHILSALGIETNKTISKYCNALKNDFLQKRYGGAPYANKSLLC